jgi:hypothetical protein
MTRRLLVLAAAVGLTLTVTVSGASAAALKVPLVGPNANFFCVDLQPADEAPAPGPGFVIFNQDGAGVVHANVRLQGAEPNTTYVVRLIQGTPSGADCFDEDALFTTNGTGNGGVNIEEPVQPDAIGAQVIIDTENVFNPPTYRGSDFYRFS